MLTKLSIVVLILCVVAVSAQTPIPPRYDGFAFGGPPSAPILLEGFFDVLCPDCAAGWPTINKVIDHYGPQLNFIMHTFPLPYHTNAFIANQGVHVVSQATKNISLVHAYAALMFQYQSNWWNPQTMNMTINQVISSMAAAVEQGGIMKASDWMVGIADADLNMDTRISWKYGCSRGVTGTPTFIINGVYTSADDTWTEQDWYTLIDGLLNQQKEKQMRLSYSFLEKNLSQPNQTCPVGESLCKYTPTKWECCLPGESCVPNVGCRCAQGETCQ